MSEAREDFSRFFLEAVGKSVRQSVLLRDYSSFQIGGAADYFFEASTVEELKSAMTLACQQSLPYYVIGGGTNILFDDGGFRGLIIKNAIKGIKLQPEEGGVEAFSGTKLFELVEFSLKENLADLEFLAGIPGTVGGAVSGNAGAFGQSIGGVLKSAMLLDDRGEVIQVEQDYFEFSYRHSALKKKHEVLLRADFSLRKGSRNEIIGKIKDYLEKRKDKHPPWGTACAGSYFKNPTLPDGKKVAAGYLLEEVGAKDLRVGEASVFSRHANFIINSGDASSMDVLSLAQELKIRVNKKFGIDLEEEVIYLPAVF